MSNFILGRGRRVRQKFLSRLLLADWVEAVWSLSSVWAWLFESCRHAFEVFLPLTFLMMAIHVCLQHSSARIVSTLRAFQRWFTNEPVPSGLEVLITPACLASTLDAFCLYQLYVTHSAPCRGRLFWSLTDTAVAAA